MLLRAPGRDRQGRKRKNSVLFHSHSASTNSSFYAHFSLPGMPFLPWISLSPCINSSVFLSGSEGKGALPRKHVSFSQVGAVSPECCPAAGCPPLLAFTVFSFVLQSLPRLPQHAGLLVQLQALWQRESGYLPARERG